VALTDPIFEWLERPHRQAVTSTVTMLELLVKPYRDESEQLVNDFYGLLSTYPNLAWIAPDGSPQTWKSSISQPGSAPGMACALRMSCKPLPRFGRRRHGLVTNDAVFERVAGFETMVLEHLL
jgi:hypothetical protein